MTNMSYFGGGLRSPSALVMKL